MAPVTSAVVPHKPPPPTSVSYPLSTYPQPGTAPTHVVTVQSGPSSKHPTMDSDFFTLIQSSLPTACTCHAFLSRAQKFVQMASLQCVTPLVVPHACRSLCTAACIPHLPPAGQAHERPLSRTTRYARHACRRNKVSWWTVAQNSVPQIATFHTASMMPINNAPDARSQSDRV